MTDQLAVNSRALIAAAAKLEHAGYDGDAYRNAAPEEETA